MIEVSSSVVRIRIRWRHMARCDELEYKIFGTTSLQGYPHSSSFSIMGISLKKEPTPS